MLSKRLEWILLLLIFALLPACAEVSVSKFSFHWITTNPDQSSVSFTAYENSLETITTKEISITTDPQEAFGVTYSTNRLGKHSIRFSSTQLSNGAESLPYSLAFSYNGESFCTLQVGTEEDLYTSSVGTVSIKRGNNELFVANLSATLTLGSSSDNVEDYPAGTYIAHLKFEVAVE